VICGLRSNRFVDVLRVAHSFPSIRQENLYGRLHSEVVESRASTVTASSVSTATLKPLQDEMDTLRDTVAGLQAHFSEFNRATKVELIQLSRTCAVLTGSAGPSDLPLAKSATGNADSAKLRSAPQDSDAVSSDAVFGISGGGRSGSVLDRLQRLELSLDTTTRASQNDVTALVQRLQRLEAEMQQANSTNSQLSSQQRRLEDLVTAQQQQQNQSDRPSAFVSDQLADVNRTCRDLARASQSATEQLNALSDRLQQVEQQAQQAKNASVSITGEFASVAFGFCICPSPYVCCAVWYLGQWCHKTSTC
jgi:DNA repair exonuclease SbcCD ATPase subunit